MAAGSGISVRVLRLGSKLLAHRALGIMVAVQTSSTIQRGADWNFSFRLQEDGNCSPYADLTDWTVTPTLKTSAGASLTTPTVTKPDAETVSLTLNQTQTAALAVQFGAVLTVNVQRPDGLDLRLIEARTTIS